MNASQVNRYTLGVIAALAFTGCGGSQVSPSPELASEQSRVRPAYSVLHSFGGSGDGKYPDAGLLNVNGTLYGTTSSGGGNDEGTVFGITTSGKESVLHSFGPIGSGDGAYPWAALINVNGALYGTTEAGGTNDDGNYDGTVFSIDTSGKDRVLYSFAGGDDGAFPFTPVIVVNGMLYGTTRNGGSVTACYPEGCGTVFETTPSGTETVLHAFVGKPDGEDPLAGLINVKGILYGTTSGGGASGVGMVFEIKKSGKETVLHSFPSGSEDGTQPVADLINVKGTLYGATEFGGGKGCVPNGCGTVFAITTSGKETVLHSFGGGSGDGASPQAGLINVNGTLYGTTYYGGVHCSSRKNRPVGCGTVFAITTSGTKSVLYMFKTRFRKDGAHPEARLLYVNGTLFGTTTRGGANGQGTVFSLTP